MPTPNGLHYEAFVYEGHEWDNVPGVVPRFFLYLEKYMKSVSSIINEFNERQHVDDLRAYVENALLVTRTDM